MFVSGIFLGAGLSTRMGHQKLLLPFGGGTVVEASLEEFLASDIDEALIVTGREPRVGELIRKRVELFRKSSRLPIKMLINPDPGRGQASSMKIGVAAASQDSRGYMFFLGDMPLTGQAVLNPLIRRFRRNPGGIVVPIFEGRRGNPVIIPADFREEILRQEGDFGGRKILKRNEERVLTVDSPRDTILLDMDDETSYRNLLQRGAGVRADKLKILLAPARAVSLSGGGGKTSMMIFLSRLLGDDGGLCMTTTTKILAPGGEDYRTGNIVRLGERNSPEIPDEVMKAVQKDEPLLLLGCEAAEGRKYSGPKPETLKAVYDAALFRTILMETDGSNGRPVKAAGEGEPVIPGFTDVCIALVGMSALGRPVDDETVHRYPVFQKLFPDHGPVVDIDMLIALSDHPEGFFREAPAGALKILLCNQWDLVAAEEKSAVRRAFIDGVKTADYLVLTSLKGAAVVEDFYQYPGR